MTRTFTCILCPNGCDVVVEHENGVILSCTGNQCGNGAGQTHMHKDAPCGAEHITADKRRKHIGGSNAACPETKPGNKGNDERNKCKKQYFRITIHRSVLR